MRNIATALLFASTAIVAPASAATVVFTGTTVGGPVFNRPVTLDTLSGVGTAVNYDPVGFTVDTAGDYTLTLTTGFDSFLALYQGAFDPASPLTNLVALNDDGVGAFGDAQLTFSLLTDISYFGVVTAFDNGVSFPYELTITGPGTANAIGGVVPEPATWAMMIVGVGAVGGAMRRRSKVSTRVSFG